MFISRFRSAKQKKSIFKISFDIVCTLPSALNQKSLFLNFFTNRGEKFRAASDDDSFCEERIFLRVLCPPAKWYKCDILPL